MKFWLCLAALVVGAVAPPPPGGPGGPPPDSTAEPPSEEREFFNDLKDVMKVLKAFSRALKQDDEGEAGGPPLPLPLIRRIIRAKVLQYLSDEGNRAAVAEQLQALGAPEAIQSYLANADPSDAAEALANADEVGAVCSAENEEYKAAVSTVRRFGMLRQEELSLNQQVADSIITLAVIRNIASQVGPLADLECGDVVEYIQENEVFGSPEELRQEGDQPSPQQVFFAIQATTCELLPAIAENADLSVICEFLAGQQ